MSMIGKSLAHYSVTAEIGKGGMGEVYQATDTKLGRSVAIKVLPEEFAKDADRIARFQREAKLLASLNHPNIAAIHGLEEAEGIHFLVMELIEGNTLADRIKAGAIPIEEALKLALQITEALEAAHEKGVIHRDLKPANIKVTPDSKVKVLDFGLAKAYAGDSENMNLSNSPTLSDAATQQGVILGTAAYMSPEQARGKPVDKRADIWAFGVVLYEMLTGKSAFSGRDVTDTLAAVIRSEPDWNSLPTNLHWRLKALLERCLEKEAKNRCSGISDARVEIQKVLTDPSGVFMQTSILTKPRKKLRVGIPWFAAAIALTAVIIGMAVWILKPAEPKKVIRFDYELPEDQHFFQRPMIGGVALAVSSDGSQFAYSTTDGIYIRSMNELDARPISGTDEDAVALFFSPDGQWIGYFSTADKKLKRISVSGGTPTDLCDATAVFNATWYKDNTIVYSDLLSGIYRVPAKGGTPELLAGGVTGLPSLLPDGKSLMFTDVSGGRPYKTIVQSLDTGEQTAVFDYEFGRYLPTGHFIYAAEDSLFAVPFDLDKLEFTGGAASMIEAGGDVSISDSGTLVYVPYIANGDESSVTPKRTLVWVYRDGREEPLGADPNNYLSGRISPDGTKVVLAVVIDGNQDIRVWDTVRKTLTRLTFDEAADYSPLWSQDGQKIIFYSARGGGGVFSKKTDGTGTVEKLYTVPNIGAVLPWSWSSDGNILALLELSLTPLGLDIGTLSMEGDRQRKELLQGKNSEAEPQISPDGRWIAYSSNESGQTQIYVRPFPDVDSGGRWQVSTSGGHSPLWSPDGDELFYRNGDATIVVPVETDQTFSPGNPIILFQGKYFSQDLAPLASITPWDIHPDGKRFLMIKPPVDVADEGTSEESTSSEPNKIIVVTNWFEELKERVPVD
jgi:serine/threonine protein kinase